MALPCKDLPGQAAAAAVHTVLWGATTTFCAKLVSRTQLRRIFLPWFLIIILIGNYVHVTAEFVRFNRSHVERFSHDQVNWDGTGSNEDDAARPEKEWSHTNGTGSKRLHQRAPFDHAAKSANENLSHVGKITEGIAQELFFADNEFNFHDAKSLEWFNKWAQEHNNEFLEQRKTKPKLGVDTFFVDKFFGHINRKDFHCGKEGCHNYPSNDEIKVGRDRHEARHIINVFRAFHKANAEVRQYTKVLHQVKMEVGSHCQNFAEVFFHARTEPKSHMCIENVFQTILLIAVSVVQSGMIWESLMPANLRLTAYIMRQAWSKYPGGPMVRSLQHNKGFGVFYKGRGIWWEKLYSQYSTFQFAMAREIIYYKPPLGWEDPESLTQDEVDAVTVYNQFMEDSLSKDLPVPRQNAKPDSKNVKYEYAGFGLLEALNTTNLNDDESSVYDQTEVASAWSFMRFPRPFPKQKTPTWDGSSTDGQSNSHGRPVHRMTRLFDITPNTAREPVGPLLKGELSAITRRLVHEDNSPMNMTEVFDFFGSNVQNITARYHQLRSPVVVYPAEYVPINQKYFFPHVKISAVDQHFPWSALISGLEFDQRGTTEDDRGTATSRTGSLQWRANHAGSAGGDHKRGLQSGQSGHIKHEIAGTLNALEALNLLSASSSSGNAKRSTRKWEIEKRLHKDSDIFVASVNGHPFKNDVLVKDCGPDVYTGETEQNKMECEVFISNAINRIASRMSAAYTTANFHSPKKMASYLQDKFATYSIWHNADQMYEPGVKGKITDNLENGLVAKAYADGNCFVRCGKKPGYRWSTSSPSVHFEDNVSCQTGCYDHVKNTYERLYGFEKPWKKDSRGKATKSPWNLDEKRIINASADAYIHRSSLGFVPGTAILNPYIPLRQDHAPILPVCYSELMYNDKLVCSCGNRYGNMTSKFAKAVNLRAKGKKNEWNAICSCLDEIKHLAYHSPAAYLLNACNVVYEIVVPGGTGSHQEYWGLGHYVDNMKACKAYQAWYHENQHLTDSQLNAGLCELWSRLAKDFDRGPNHKHPDFSYVNDMLEDHGCKDFHRR